jgi:broad specificity phosphatase PhoE
LHLFLIRHGQSHVNLDDWDGGYVDTGLTPLGEQQSERLAQWVAGHVRADFLYTSTMARALETTVYLAKTLNLEAEADNRLREFGNCYADGTPVPPEAMPIQYAAFWGTERPYTRINERGESWLLFRLRVGAFIDDVLARHGGGSDAAESERGVLVVCHGGVVDAAADYIFNVGAHRRVEFLVHNTGITHWEHRSEPGREPWRLHATNMAYHLIGEDGAWLGSKAILSAVSRKTDSDAADE